MPFFSHFRREIFRKLFAAGDNIEEGGASVLLEPEIRLVVGLGNPGRQYAETRHNIGFMVADHLAARWGVKFTNAEPDVLVAAGWLKDTPAALIKPQSYMNLSGPAVFGLAEKYGIDKEALMVIYDDLDLPFGKIKIKSKGGHGGHKGIQSIIQSFGGGEFPRLRIGVGRPVENDQVTKHVLGRFDAKEEVVLGSLVELAGDAVEITLQAGCMEGMNRFNNQQITA